MLYNNYNLFIYKTNVVTSRKMLVPLSVTSKSNVFRLFTLDSHRRNLTFITFMIFYLQIQIYS